MIRNLLFAAFVLTSFGCQTLLKETKLPQKADISFNKGSGEHVIDVEFDERLNQPSSSIAFRHRVQFGVEYIFVSGSIKKAIGAPSLEYKKVNIRFVDKEGKTIEEGVTRVAVARLRPPVGTRAKFSLKLLYHREFSKCIISLEPNQ